VNALAYCNARAMPVDTGCCIAAEIDVSIEASLNQRVTEVSRSTTSIFRPDRCFGDVLHLKHLKHSTET
jgi:hypothetical protein